MGHPDHTRQRREAGFISIHLIAIIVLILLVTGLGQYLWRNSLQLGNYCQSLVAEMELYELSDTCMAIGTSMASLRNRLEQMVGASEFGNMMNLEEYAGMMARKLTSQTLGFNAPQLNNMIDPKFLSGMPSGGSSMDQLRTALTQGTAGSHYLSQGNASAGIPYLKSSANMGEYGVLSQLSLGSAYMNGGNGVPRDLSAAKHYNSQALQSIRKLQASDSAEAKKLLSALPASPDQLTQSLQGVITKLDLQK